MTNSSIDSIVNIIDGTKLRECKDVNNVDGILTSMGVPEGPARRTTYLYEFMGAGTNVLFTCGTFSEAELYATAKAELVYNYNGFSQK